LEKKCRYAVPARTITKSPAIRSYNIMPMIEKLEVADAKDMFSFGGIVTNRWKSAR